MADKMVIEWDEAGLERAIGKDEGVHSKINSMTQSRISQANSLCAGFRTGIYHDHATGKTVGNTQAVYGGDVQKMGTKRWPIGIVHPVNYAAMKDNYLHNTLLKVK